MNTAAKRLSAVNLSLPWRTPPLPTGTDSSALRQHRVYYYAGIAWEAEVDTDDPRTVTLVWTPPDYTLVWSAPSRRLIW